MNNKRVWQLLMTGILIVCTLSACGRKEVSETTAAVNTEAEITDSTITMEDSQEKEESEKLQDNSEENKNSKTVTIQATTPYVFSEGFAWVRTDTPNQLAVIDTDGSIMFTLDNVSDGIKVSAADSSKGITYDPIEATPFYDGASVVHPSRYLNAYGFAIYDTNGNLLTSSDDGDDATDIKFLAEGEGIYLLAKTTSGFSENKTVVYCIDKNGNMKSDEIEFSESLHNRDWDYIGNGNFAFGGGGIIDGKFIRLDNYDIYNNADADIIKDYIVQIVGREGVIPGTVMQTAYIPYDNLLYDRDNLDKFDSESGWYDKDLNLAVSVPDYPDGVTVDRGGVGQFNGGYAPVKLRGADGKYYFTVIDKTGNQVYEPVGGVKNVPSFNGWSYSSSNGIVTFTGSENGSLTYYIIDKDGTLYNLSDDVSAFTGTVYADWGYESHVISVAEGFKYIPDGSLQYLKLDGTRFDQAVLSNNTVNVQFTQGYKK